MVEKKKLSSIALAALASSSCFVVLVAVLHVLRSDVDPFLWGMSFYAVGSYSALMTAAFLLFGVTGFLVATAVRRSAQHSRAGVVLLALAAAALVAVAAFPSNTVPPANGNDVAHVAASAVFFLCFAAASQLISWRHTDRRMRSLTVAIALTYLASLLLTFFGPAGVHGLLQRTTVSAAVVWLAATALLLPSERHRRVAA
jgi:hypothetical membrane protein